jgi:hypothetical protein
MAYRKDKRPPRLLFSRVEVVPVLSRSVFVPPGESIESSFPIPTPDRQGGYFVYLYLIVGESEKLVWKEVPIHVEIKSRASAATRRIWGVRTLLAMYVIGVMVVIYCFLRRHGSG